MRTAFTVMLVLVFLGAFGAGVASYASEVETGREIKVLFCTLIATVSLAALYIGEGQDAIIDELARRQHSSDTEAA